MGHDIDWRGRGGSEVNAAFSLTPEKPAFQNVNKIKMLLLKDIVFSTGVFNILLSDKALKMIVVLMLKPNLHFV